VRQSLSQTYLVLNLHDLEPRPLEDVFECFDVCDSNHDGVISKSEFVRLLASLRERAVVNAQINKGNTGSMMVGRGRFACAHCCHDCLHSQPDCVQAYTFFSLLFYPIFVCWARPSR
jgi:Ca2+-binding EF-hand superfamily protein